MPRRPRKVTQKPGQSLAMAGRERAEQGKKEPVGKCLY